ncbi:MAG: hypothetical protein WC551_09520 [Patescibacteria group bacterium]
MANRKPLVVNSGGVEQSQAGDTVDIASLDNKKVLFGTGLDASIYYDGTNLIVNPREVGSGYLSVLGSVYCANNIAVGTSVNTSVGAYIKPGTYTTGGDKWACAGEVTVDTGWDSGWNYGFQGIGNATGTAGHATARIIGMSGRGYVKGSGAIQYCIGVMSECYFLSTATSTVAWGVNFLAPGMTQAGGASSATLQNCAGLYIAAMAFGTARYGVYQAGYDKNVFGGHVCHSTDLTKAYFGAANDASIVYDGTNFVINPKEVGAGILDVAGTIQTDGYNAADGTAGASATVTVADAEGDSQAITFKNGLYTGVSETVSRKRSFILYNTTTDDTITELFLDGSSSRLTIAEGVTWFFSVRLIGRQTNGDYTTGGSFWTGILTRDSGGSASMPNNAQLSNCLNDFGWDWDIKADTTNQSLLITVQGGATDTVKWVADVELVIVS